jgi:hypothetical protein
LCLRDRRHRDKQWNYAKPEGEFRLAREFEIWMTVRTAPPVRCPRRAYSTIALKQPITRGSAVTLNARLFCGGIMCEIGRFVKVNSLAVSLAHDMSG